MFILNSSDVKPLYKQLYDQIKGRILSGRLPAGSKLPSVRDLARELSVSRNTIEGAFHDLLAEGYIYSKPRSGYCVSPLETSADEAMVSFPHHPGQFHPRQTPSAVAFDFHPARLAPESFPTRLWRKCFIQTLEQGGGQLSHYADRQGIWELRCAIQKYLGRSRGVICDPDQIVVCAGLQHSLEIVAHLLRKDHSIVAVENPGYHLPRSVFRNHSYDILPVPVGCGGMELDTLKAGTSTIAYVTPSHQFPLGHVMPVVNRLNLIDWAESGKRFVIEDDHDSELRYHGKPIPALQGLRPGGNIIYIGTFSKILSPALRLSYLVLPESLLPAYRRVFHDYFSTVSLLEQTTLARFMGQGHWERHVRRMRTIYKSKHDALLSSVERHFGTRAEVIGQGAGLHVVLRLVGNTLDEAELIARAREHDIGLFPFSRTRVTSDPEPVKIVLGFGGMAAAELERGVELLSRISA